MASTFTPAGSPPPGVTPNFDNPSDTLFPEIVATVTLSIAATTFFTVARLVAKKATSSFTIEDYFSAATWVMFVGYATTFLLQGLAGIGRHIWDIKVEEAPRISKLSWSIELMYCIITFFAKATLLLQLQRTFSPNRTGAVHIVCQLLIYGNLAFYLGSFIALIVECVPQERIWNPLITTGRCIKTGDLLIAMGIINIISDLMILILPIWTIFHLRISTKLKLGVSAVFATGVLAFTCSILRLAYTIPPLHSDDSSYLFAPVGLWSIAEMTSIILCTSFPLMPRFWKFLTRKRTSSSLGSQQHRYGQFDPDGNRAIQSNIITTSLCVKCQHEIPCPIHKTHIQCSNSGLRDDEERLYIHKTVSIEMMSHKSNVQTDQEEVEGW